MGEGKLESVSLQSRAMQPSPDVVPEAARKTKKPRTLGSVRTTDDNPREVLAKQLVDPQPHSQTNDRMCIVGDEDDHKCQMCGAGGFETEEDATWHCDALIVTD